MDYLSTVVDLQKLDALHLRAEHWVLTELLSAATLVQLAVILAAALLALLLARPLRPLAERLVQYSRRWERSIWLAARSLVSLVYPLVLVVLLWLLSMLAGAIGHPRAAIATAISLLVAWLLIRLIAAVIRDAAWMRTAALIVWGLAALDILGLLSPLLDQLALAAFTFGNRRVSALSVVEAALVLLVLLWLGTVVARLAEVRLQRSSGITPSIRVLLAKSLRIALVGLAVLIAINSLGVDLTAFAVFTGALGVGIGFGLQKVVSNLISGLILLVDRSIKPGDVIELEGSFGWVSALRARYAAITTRDGKEWLIPNEDLITQRVINWSYSDSKLRLPMQFGISYESDPRQAIAVAVEAALQVPRVLRVPAPVCRVMGFGDSAIDLELRIWIDDPSAGIVNVRSDVFLALWDGLRANGIGIPFPQRDIHLRSAEGLEIGRPGPPEGS